jgi:tetratricopeptide (TPR) repeat protein
MIPLVKGMVFLILLAALFSGCASLRTEFYREETRHLYESGCRSYKQGDYDAARIAFSSIVELDPDYGPAHAALGNLAMIGEDYEQAYEHYQRALRHDPELRGELLPLVMISDTHTARRPLIEAGVELADVYPLVMDEKFAELQKLLGQKDLPLELLATDSLSLTPGRIGELRQKAAELAPEASGPAPYRLFLCYLLFYSADYDQICLRLLDDLTLEASGPLVQQAHVLAGRLRERLGDKKGARDGYLAAVNAGLPMEAVAHHLARLYLVDIKTILPTRQEGREPPESQPVPEKTVFTAVISSAPVEPVPNADAETVITLPGPDFSPPSTTP